MIPRIGAVLEVARRVPEEPFERRVHACEPRDFFPLDRRMEHRYRIREGIDPGRKRGQITVEGRGVFEHRMPEFVCKREQRRVADRRPAGLEQHERHRRHRGMAIDIGAGAVAQGDRRRALTAPREGNGAMIVIVSNDCG
jgi:hypothetical protein